MDEVIDTNNEDPKYWEEILKKFNLSMTRGSNQHAVSYTGSLRDLTKIDNGAYAKSLGLKKQPKEQE